MLDGVLYDQEAINPKPKPIIRNPERAAGHKHNPPL